MNLFLREPLADLALEIEMSVKMISENQIPKRIRQIRLERDLTQKDLADAVGVTKVIYLIPLSAWK